jgi:hypothetical protein
MTSVIDFYYFDHTRKRWGWMKSWSKLRKGLFFSGFLAAALFIYLGISSGHL